MHKDKPKPEVYNKDKEPADKATGKRVENWDTAIAPPWDYAPMSARLQDCRMQLLIAGLITEKESAEIVTRFNRKIGKQRYERLKHAAAQGVPRKK